MADSWFPTAVISHFYSAVYLWIKRVKIDLLKHLERGVRLKTILEHYYRYSVAILFC